MRAFRLLMLSLIAVAGCASDTGGGSPGSNNAGAKPRSSVPPSASTNRARFTAENNPTALAGRGAPTLDEADRPAAWIYMDGKAGKFSDRDGRRMIEWVISQTVGSTPTFRVEAYEPLVGDARDFKCILRNIDSTEGTQFSYGITAAAGSFALGQDYSVVNPGDNFTIRNGLTGDMVREIAPLAPGKYAITAGAKNSQTGKEALAVTYFTVGEGK